MAADCSADAWLYETGKTFETNSIYYTLPSNSYNSITTNEAVPTSVYVKDMSDRTASTYEIQYGISDEQTLKGKFDFGVVRNNLDLVARKNGVVTKYKIPVDYGSISSQFAYRQQLGRDIFGVLSTTFSVYPGEWVIAKNKTYLITEQMSYEIRLLYGTSFDTKLHLFDAFGKENETLYHYFEWQMAARHYPEMHQVEWNLDLHLGIRPAEGNLLVVGLYNTLEGATFNKVPFSGAHLSNVVNSITTDPAQRTFLYNNIKSTYVSPSTYRQHKLNLKYSYQIAPDSNIGLEGFVSVFTQKPFANKTVVLSYDLKY